MMLQLGPNEPSLITKTQTGIHHGSALPGAGRLWPGVSVCADFDSSPEMAGIKRSSTVRVSQTSHASQHADGI